MEQEHPYLHSRTPLGRVWVNSEGWHFHPQLMSSLFFLLGSTTATTALVYMYQKVVVRQTK
jgi:hypothetical protein